MQTHEAIHYQRVNTPLTTENLDATKAVRRPPSRCIPKSKSKKAVASNVDLVTSREGYFSGTASSINSRLIYLADIGRCDLYGRSNKRMQEQSDHYALPKRDLETWFTISSENCRTKMQETRRTTDSDQRLINEFSTPEISSIVKGKVELPFNITPHFLVNTIDEEIDNIRYKRYTINMLKKAPRFIVDSWWWIYLDRFCLKSENRTEFSKKEIAAAKEELMYKISEKFIHMVLESERLSQRDFMGNCHVQFFRQLAKLMSLIVYSGFCHAWTNDRPLFVNNDFHQYLLDTFSLWIEGIRHAPGTDDDDMWRRVEPHNMRKNEASSKEKGAKGANMRFDFSKYLEAQTGEGKTSGWKIAQTRLTIIGEVGESLNRGSIYPGTAIPLSGAIERRMSRRRQTLCTRKSLPSDAMVKLGRHVGEDKTIVFNSSKFDVNGCSPLFELALPSRTTQRLVSRRSCAPKSAWKENPLYTSGEHVKRAKECIRNAKNILNKEHLGRP